MPVHRSLDILHVDADKTERRITEALLRRAIMEWRGDGVRIDATLYGEPTVESALRRLSTQPFDCILVDLTLPDARGLEVIHAFRTVAPCVPVIVLSQTLDPVDAVSSMSMGIHDWISKAHLDPERLVMSILRAVTQGSTPMGSLAAPLVVPPGPPQD